MKTKKYLEELPVYDIVRLPKTGYTKNAVCYKGLPRKHPYDKEKIIFIPSPLDHPRFFYEFNVADIVHAEDLSNIVTEAGSSMQLVSIWVREGAHGIRMEVFEIGSSS